MGEYHLYGWVPGVLGDYKLETAIIISPGLYFISKHNIILLYLYFVPWPSIPFVYINYKTHDGRHYTNSSYIWWYLGLDVNLGEITFHPPRQGKTSWEIGIPDRTASEFFIPEPNPRYVNKLFVNHPER